jgi:hypothetical protein
MKQILAVLLLIVFFGFGCVTRTEKLPYHRYAPPPEDESVLEELRREVGWQSSPGSDPFYKRAARGVKETVSSWFHTEKNLPLTKEEREQTHREYEQERQEALRRLRERQEDTK